MESGRDPNVVFKFERDRRAPQRARQALSGIFDVEDPLAEPVALAVSELVSNVVLHTEAGGEMRVWDPKPEVPLRLEIEDGSQTEPVPRVPSDDREGGWGLSIVQRVADGWGTITTATGKVVWAEFDRHKRSAQQPSAGSTD